jgi:hypothetical protein
VKLLKIGFVLIMIAVGILALTTAVTMLSEANQPKQTSGFNATEYCSRYRAYFNVSYCPAESTTKTASGFLDLSQKPFVEMLAIGAAVALLVSGSIIIMVDLERNRS